MFFFSSRRRHTRWPRDWSSDVCSSDLRDQLGMRVAIIVDGGTSPREIASTIVDLTDEEARWKILREGAISAQTKIGRASCRGKSVDIGGRRIIRKNKSIHVSTYYAVNK